MILTIDVGNTNITCGVFQGDEIAASFRITTKMPRTSDEYGMMLMNLLEQNDIHPAEIKDAIICSVVPNVMHSLRGGPPYISYAPTASTIRSAPICCGFGVTMRIPVLMPASTTIGVIWKYLSSPPLREGSQHPESGFQQKPCGKMLQNFRRSRSKSRHQFSEKTRSQVCRRGLCTDRSDRPNTSSTA